MKKPDEEVIYQPTHQNMADGDLYCDSTLALATVVHLNAQAYFTYRAPEILSRSVSSAHTIDFSNNSIGDIGAYALAKMAALRDLRVSHCEISDNGATALFSHPGLHRLSIDGNTLSAESLKLLPDNNALHYLKIDCSPKAIPYLSRCTFKTLDAQFIDVQEDLQTRLKRKIIENQNHCKQFIDSTTEILKLAKWKAPLFKNLPAQIIQDICFSLGRHLPKTPIQIACCIIFLQRRISTNSEQTTLEYKEKVQAWTLLNRHMKIDPNQQPPEQYIDDLPLTIFTKA